MTRLCAAFLLALVSLVPAAAQELPSLYDVTGVAQNDVLNIREHPRATSQRIGALEPDASGIEVTALSDSGDWGRVNTGERSGWLSMEFMTPAPAPRTGDSYFDGPLACFGTEPFWRLENGVGGEMTFSGAGEVPVMLTRTATALSASRGRAAQLVEAADETAKLTGMLRVGECSDGMSDRAYGLTLDMLLETGGDRRFVSGCCSVSAE